MKSEIRRLFLAAPLIYLKEPNEHQVFGDPFVPQEECEERFYCFELAPSQAMEFEPDETSFIKSLIFGGRISPKGSEEPDAGAEKVELPPGNYLFSQKEGRLPREEIIEIAIELQKEGLWQRLTPGLHFYLRYLNEDGRGVTQVFRPYNQKTYGLEA